MSADWTLMPVDQVHRRPRGRPVLVTLPWPATLAHDPWLGLLLPTRDYNRAMMEALGRTHLPEDCFVGLFLAHPFLDLERWLDLLSACGAAGLAAFPGITRLDGQFARTAEQAGLSHGTEIERLAAAAETGVATMASLGSTEFAGDTGGLRPDWLLSAVTEPSPGTAARGIVDYRPGTVRAGMMTLHARS